MPCDAVATAWRPPSAWTDNVYQPFLARIVRALSGLFCLGLLFVTLGIGATILFPVTIPLQCILGLMRGALALTVGHIALRRALLHGLARTSTRAGTGTFPGQRHTAGKDRGKHCGNDNCFCFHEWALLLSTIGVVLRPQVNRNLQCMWQPQHDSIVNRLGGKCFYGIAWCGECVTGCFTEHSVYRGRRKRLPPRAVS